MRKPREAYVRVLETIAGVNYVLGLEIRDGEDVREWYAGASALIFAATTGLDGDDLVLATAIEHLVRTSHPDRAYFLEVCHDEEETRWVQLFQPWAPPVET